jgi:hypothetical protein
MRFLAKSLIEEADLSIRGCTLTREEAYELLVKLREVAVAVVSCLPPEGRDLQVMATVPLLAEVIEEGDGTPR